MTDELLSAASGKQNTAKKELDTSVVHEKDSQQEKSEIKSMINHQIVCEDLEKEVKKNNLSAKKSLEKLQKEQQENFEKYPAYKSLSSQEMMQEYQKQFNEEFQQEQTIECDEKQFNSLKELYDKKYANKNEQKSGQENDPDKEDKIPAIVKLLFTGQSNKKDKDNKEVFHFNSPEELVNFLKEAADNGIKMRIMDEDGNVMAYSNGDGKLYHADNNQPFSSNDHLRSSNMSLDEFMTKQAQENSEISKASPSSPTLGR